VFPPGGGDLFERSEQLAMLEAHLADVVKNKLGRVVAIAGEAGVGKTTLVREFCRRADGAPRVLTGACEPLHTARPLGPFVELGEAAGLTLMSGLRPDELLAALLGEIGMKSPTIVVLEDLHWADETTLDVLRLLARRIESRPALVLATYRDEELERTHPFRMLLGDLPATVARLKVPPFSQTAVADLARQSGLDGEELYRKTGGNPFFVTEVLASAGATVPDTVRDAVLARAARLGPERRAVLEAIAVTPPHTELWLLEAIAPESREHLDRCLSSGIVTAQGDTVAFRHELARLAIEESLFPGRRLDLHRQTLWTLSAHEPAIDPARLAHHAEAASEPAAVLAYAPRAAEQAAAVGAHREAAAQYARALLHEASMSPEVRADTLERHSQECYLASRGEEAIASGRAAAEAFHAIGDGLREADSLLKLSTMERMDGRGEDATASAGRALELLGALPPARELAMAYATTSQIAMCNAATDQMLEAATKALDLAETIDDNETLAHVLITLGTMEMELEATRPEGREKLLRGVELARVTGHEHLVGRGYNNLIYEAYGANDLASVEAYVDQAVAYSTERGLDVFLQCAIGSRAELELIRGEWDKAIESALTVLSVPSAAIPRMGPLVVIGLARARRGDPDPWSPLDVALSIATGIGELQMVAPMVAARSEVAWLEGRTDLVVAETDDIAARARRAHDDWALREIAVWRRRAGIDETPAGGETSPRRLTLAGEHAAAAAEWDALGYPYEAALALLDSNEEPHLREALERLQAFGARAAAAIAARRLRELGARGVPRGPRASTAGNPARLTHRELEVLGLVSEGLRDAEIAARLHLSEKTVGHHVSSILRKLDVPNRGQAAAAAARLGLAAPER
jgi:DNA-binding CsgD family transcriptional regulator